MMIGLMCASPLEMHQLPCVVGVWVEVSYLFPYYIKEESTSYWKGGQMLEKVWISGSQSLENILGVSSDKTLLGRHSQSTEKHT